MFSTPVISIVASATSAPMLEFCGRGYKTFLHLFIIYLNCHLKRWNKLNKGGEKGQQTIMCVKIGRVNTELLLAYCNAIANAAVGWKYYQSCILLPPQKGVQKL